ncbi:MAG: RpiB/LacA/LacB family sugar-phosphate isomerase [Candidatus Dojkabacteria bacterium]
MEIFIASDHGGFELKNKIKEYLESKNLDFLDLGPKRVNPEDDYPDYAFAVATEMQNNPESLGILICRSGNGMCIAANKVKGIYAALCFTSHHAQKAREDDNANVLCLDSDYEGEDDHLKIVESFINSKFAGPETRHGRRFMKIVEFENNN